MAATGGQSDSISLSEISVGGETKEAPNQGAAPPATAALDESAPAQHDEVPPSTSNCSSDDVHVYDDVSVSSHGSSTVNTENVDRDRGRNLSERPPSPSSYHIYADVRPASSKTVMVVMIAGLLLALVTVIVLPVCLTGHCGKTSVQVFLAIVQCRGVH